LNRTISTHIEIGTRIHSILYGGRDGVVYAIQGKQSPETVRSIFGGAMMTGGGSHFDIVFDNGTESRGLPECILRGVQWRIYADIARPEEIAFLREHVASETERKRIEADAAAKKFAADKDALRSDPRYSKLKQTGSGDGGGKLVASNLRIELKAAFPGVKFSIRSDYNSVRVAWVDGPTTDEVKAFTGKYEAGHFDGMDDSYHYSRRPFTNVYGSAQYIFENRSHSVAAMIAAAKTVQKMYDSPPFTVHESSDGTGYIDCNSNDDQRLVYSLLEKRYPFEVVANGCRN
jgi:hypothetical protein